MLGLIDEYTKYFITAAFSGHIRFSAYSYCRLASSHTMLQINFDWLTFSLILFLRIGEFIIVSWSTRRLFLPSLKSIAGHIYLFTYATVSHTISSIISSFGRLHCSLSPYDAAAFLDDIEIERIDALRHFRYFGWLRGLFGITMITAAAEALFLHNDNAKWLVYLLAHTSRPRAIRFNAFRKYAASSYHFHFTLH